MMSPAAEVAPLAFPCQFPIKVLGRRGPGFAQQVTNVVLRHAPDFDPATIELRPSRQGRYLSVTCTVLARSRTQLDALYQDLCDQRDVVMVL